MDESEPEPTAWSQRRMIRGKWRETDAQTGEPTRADKTISVRLTSAELAELDAQIASLGLTRNRALRIAARRVGGFLEADPAVREQLKDISRQIGGIATNINQIAKAANRTHDPNYRAFMTERQALGRELMRLKADMQEILDLSARREDGLRRLIEAAT